MLTVSNFSYAGTQKYVSHAVMLSFTKEPKTLCGMDVYKLLNRAGQEWEVQETNEPHSVGCVKCLRLLTQRAPDDCRVVARMCISGMEHSPPKK